MIKLENPHYNYEIEIPEPLAELQTAIWDAGFDGRVYFDIHNAVSLHSTAECVERLLHWHHNLTDAGSPVFRFWIVSHPSVLPEQPGQLPDPFGDVPPPLSLDEEDPLRHDSAYRARLGRRVDMVFDRRSLRVVSDCARWMAGGPRPDFSEGSSTGHWDD